MFCRSCAVLKTTILKDIVRKLNRWLILRCLGHHERLHGVGIASVCTQVSTASYWFSWPNICTEFWDKRRLSLSNDTLPHILTNYVERTYMRQQLLGPHIEGKSLSLYLHSHTVILCTSVKFEICTVEKCKKSSFQWWLLSRLSLLLRIRWLP